MISNEERAAILAEREYPPYGLMITRLFKQIEEPFGSLMHASIGLTGEAGELLQADSFKNVREECGDLEFYIEALKQHFTPDFAAAKQISNKLPDVRAAKLTLGAVFVNVVTLTTDIQDIVKKSWIYKRELDAGEVTRLVLILELNMAAIYKLFDTSLDDVKLLNQVKLIGPTGRFQSGFYSDAAAIKRTDKEPGEDRSFFGKGRPIGEVHGVASQPGDPVGKLVDIVKYDPPVRVPADK